MNDGRLGGDGGRGTGHVRGGDGWGDYTGFPAPALATAIPKKNWYGAFQFRVNHLIPM